MKITTGKWDIWQNSDDSYAIVINDFYKGEMISKDDAILAADAGNTYQSTNKLPSELAEANKELLEALQLLLDGNNAPDWKKEICSNLIKKYRHA